MGLAHVTSTTRIVSSKSDVQHLHDSCTQHEKCRRILKHVLKPYDSRSHNQTVRMTSCMRSLLDASRARYKRSTRQSKAEVVPSKSALRPLYFRLSRECSHFFVVPWWVERQLSIVFRCVFNCFLSLSRGLKCLKSPRFQMKAIKKI